MRVFVKVEYSDNYSFASARGTLVFRVDAELEVLQEMLGVPFILGRKHYDEVFKPLSYPANPANHGIIDMAAEHARRFAATYTCYNMRVEVKAIEDIEARRKELMDELRSLDEGHEWV